MPRLSLLRRIPSSGACNTKENGARKRHSKQEAKPPCRSWCHGQLFFLHLFLRFVLLLLLHHSVKLTIPHYHIFLLFQILHLVLFKSLQLQCELSISRDICIVFWWDRDGNCWLSFLSRDDLPFVRNGFFAVYFRPIFDPQFWTVVLLVLQKYGEDCAVIGGRSINVEISGCAIDLVFGAQCKCKRKRWFVCLRFPVNLSGDWLF